MKHLQFSMVLMAVFMLFSCNKSAHKFKPEPPFKHLDPVFTTMIVDASKDSTYILENGTRIVFPAGCFMDENGEKIKGSVTVKYRQFDDAASIYLAGMPMRFGTDGSNQVLETAGMFEIRAMYNNQDVRINPDRPIQLTLGSNFTDTRQGFFFLDENSGSWQLEDIPQGKLNPERDSLKNVLKKLTSVFRVPTGPGYFVFSYARMADIFIGEDNYEEIYKANMKEMEAKMKKYGVSSLRADFRYPRVKYKGNEYDVSEMLWKTVKPVKFPSWIKDVDIYTTVEGKKKSEWQYKYTFNLKPTGHNRYEFTFTQKQPDKSVSFEAEMVMHLRYLLKYSLDQWKTRQESIDREITENENRLKASRLIEYTVNLYKMGIYNCDRPVFFRSVSPLVTFELDGKPVDPELISNASAFNANLSSCAYASRSANMMRLSLFKETNRLMVTTRNGEVGILTTDEFNRMKIDSLLAIPGITIRFNLKRVKVPEKEEDFRNLLQ